ncbi:hypothetical protein BDZ94DRAFT_1246477 [Collybia nuda]|uniref:Uncharacterized protein n=1 Tax=Collybia nuda TaxID=64659 RepID=A0A9P6CNI5_9AGAR|nr:hypothetical protein BDZ94DRAFT_1246477 [Collybia nuda]
MANSSASSINYPKSSRFSTLNVFKFSKSKPPSDQPPPLPPKDTYYLQNRSLVSLLPDTRSMPPHSPLSPNSQYSRRPDMNQSSMSLVSSATSARSFSPADPPSGESRKKKGKASSFFRFGKRGPRSPQTAGSSPSDDGISLPWNFQHNIHVDEGYTGLPPSWTMSLAQAGFTEEEIADIQNRRAAGTRSPGSQYLFTDRPASPTYVQNNAPPIIKNPTPRSTSLPRQFPDASLRSAPQRQQRSPQHSNITTLVTSPSNGSLRSNQTPRRQYSTDQSSTHQPTSSISMSHDSHHSSNSSISQDSTLRNIGETYSPPAAEPFQPSTPPRRMYHVANELPTIHSPPPSYSHYSSTPNGNGYPVDSKSGYKYDQSTSSANSTPRSNPTPQNTTPVSPSNIGRQGLNRSGSSDHSMEDDDSPPHSPSSSASTSPSKTTPRPRAGSHSKRLTALPPRLSLHKANDSTDLSTWGEALLSGMSTASANATPNTSTFAAAQDAKLMTSSQGKSVGLGSISTSSSLPLQASASTSRRQPPPTRPIPSLQNGRPKIELRSSFDSDEGEDDEIPSSAYAEPSTTARYDPSGAWEEESESITSASDIVSPIWSALKGVVSNEITREDEVYSAALNDASSPTIPFGPLDGLGATIKEGQGYSREDGHEGFLTADRERTNRDSSRSSTSTVTELTKHPAVVRNASVARRAGAYVIDKSKVANLQQTREVEVNGARGARPAAPRTSPPAVSSAHPPSPLSSNFGSEEGSASGSNSSSSLSQDHQTPTTDAGQDSPLLYYLDSSPSPDPSKVSFSPAAHHHMLVSTTDTFGGVHKEDQRMGGIDEDEEEMEEDESPISVPRPTIVVSGVSPNSPENGVTSSQTLNSPFSPYQRYRGWLSTVVAPLEDFIDEAIDPRKYYEDLLEIAEGESGSVYAATLIGNDVHKLKLPPLVKAKDINSLNKGEQVRIAIKSVAILPSGSPKLVDLQRELSLMRGLGHENILSMDSVYVDLVEDSLWIRMELMERSLADMVGLVDHGLMLHDRTIARFASDTLEALEYLQKHRIAHRDVRSDNLLLNGDGVLKLTDFSNAVQVTRESPMRSEPSGVLYWQAPEIRTPPYNALQVDVWSLGATVWEMAEAEPPFALTQQIGDRWPRLSRPETYSPSFHEFLHQCSEPAASRPSPSDLRKTPFIQNACGRLVIRQLLAQCMAIERLLQQGEEDSQGPISE